MSGIIKADVIIAGASLSSASAAKRLVEAGYHVIALERFKLPRHKPCSGILSPRGHRFLLENFGPLPPEALHQPTSCRGVTFHFPSMKSVAIDFDYGPTPHLHRKFSDHWAIKQSGVEVHDNTRLTNIIDRGTHVDITARRDKEDIQYQARYVIAADGPNSTVVRSIYPGYPKTIPWFKVKQFMHDVIDCPLDVRYFHFWFHPELGHYTWSHRRDNQQIVGVGSEAGDNLNKRSEKVLSYLKEKHGVILHPSNCGESSVNNFGPSLINNYVFGKGNIIVTGQAAGFLNMIAEGMSAALHSGAIAGEAVVEALAKSADLQKTYRAMIASEVKHCTDQWNPYLIAFGRPHEADFWGAVEKAGHGKLGIAIELIRFIQIYGHYNWGRRMLHHGLHRLLRGFYPEDRWI